MILDEINQLGNEQHEIYCRLSSGRSQRPADEGRLRSRLDVIRRKLAVLWEERRGEKAGSDWYIAK